MEQKIPEDTTFKRENYHHVGVIVKDMGKTIAYLTSIGIGPFGNPNGSLYIEASFKGELHGKPAEWKVKISNAKIGDSELELLEPCGGESALQEWLDTHGEGLHHIGYLVDDVPVEIDRLVKQGVKVITAGKGKRSDFAYFDTGVIGGIVTEIRSR